MQLRVHMDLWQSNQGMLMKSPLVDREVAVERLITQFLHKII